MKKEIIYKASLDKMALAITIGVLALFLGIGQSSLRLILFDERSFFITSFHVLVILLFLGIYLGCYLYGPKSYVLTNDQLRIRRLIGDKIIPYETINKVTILSDKEREGILRSYGVGGVFGYFGIFDVPHHGKTHFYTTQRKILVLLEITDGEKLVISPDDVHIVEVLNRAVKKG